MQPTSPMKSIPFSLFMALSLTSLVGCGDDGDGGTDTSADSTGTTAAVSSSSTSAATTSGATTGTTQATATTEGEAETEATDTLSDSETDTAADTDTAGPATDTDGGTETGTGSDTDDEVDTDTDGATGGPDWGAVASELSDAEILHVLGVANAGEIEAAELAESRASDQAVIDYAEAMIAEHTGAQDEVDGVAEALELTPEASTISGTLAEASTMALALLEDASEEEFDVVYMESQVAMHAQVLSLVEGMLEGADAEELTSLLETLQSVIQAHHDHAVAILEDLE